MKNKQKEISQRPSTPETDQKEVLTTSEFTYWLSLYRSRVYEAYFTALTRQVS
ncbi:MAG: hypothetical protein H7Z72_03120 [Bacteroidetes bacterium]|nr:hypothetical protein [Fibrella sp.]